jgi:hypothetical protein
MFECVEPEKDVSDGVIALALHEAQGKALRRLELASRESKLEGFIEDVLIGGILGKGPLIINGGVIIVP